MASMYPVAHRTVPAFSFAMDIMQLTEYRQLSATGIHRSIPNFRYSYYYVAAQCWLHDCCI